MTLLIFLTLSRERQWNCLLYWRFVWCRAVVHRFVNRLFAFRCVFVHSFQRGLPILQWKLGSESGHFSQKYFCIRTWQSAIAWLEQFASWNIEARCANFRCSVRKRHLSRVINPHHQVSDGNTHWFEGPFGYVSDEIFRKWSPGLPELPPDRHSSNNLKKKFRSSNPTMILCDRTSPLVSLGRLQFAYSVEQWDLWTRMPWAQTKQNLQLALVS